jgi:NhaP-type Na+/H+ and K+/H+ antiporter
MRQDNEDLRRSVAEKEREKENLTQLLNSEKKSSASKLAAMESSNSDLIKAKNDAIAKLNKDLEELKLRYNKDMISNSETRNSLGEQIKQLINTSNESKSDAIATKKELSQTKQILEKKTAEADDLTNKLKIKSSEYDALMKKTN